MPTVDLTPRLARESRPGHKDTILFDKTLPGFGLRIHPVGFLDGAKHKPWMTWPEEGFKGRHVFCYVFV